MSKQHEYIKLLSDKDLKRMLVEKSVLERKNAERVALLRNTKAAEKNIEYAVLLETAANRIETKNKENG